MRLPLSEVCDKQITLTTTPDACVHCGKQPLDRRATRPTHLTRASVALRAGLCNNDCQPTSGREGVMGTGGRRQSNVPGGAVFSLEEQRREIQVPRASVGLWRALPDARRAVHRGTFFLPSGFSGMPRLRGVLETVLHVPQKCRERILNSSFDFPS